MEFSKLYCPIHRAEIITNFCNKEECQTGLCASCVCTHTSAHLSRGTNPSYENIRATYADLVNQTSTRMQNLENLKDRLHQLNQKVNNKRQAVLQAIHRAKSETISLINNFYEQRQKQLLLEINLMDQKHGLHCQTRLKNLQVHLDNQICLLESAIKSLNYYNFLDVLPKIKMQQLHNANVMAAQVSAEVTSNQKYNVIVNYNKNCYDKLLQELSKIVTLSETLNDCTPLSKNLRTSEVAKSYQVTKQAVDKVEAQKIIYDQLNLFTLRRHTSRHQHSHSTIEIPKQNSYASKQFNLISEVDKTQKDVQDNYNNDIIKNWEPYTMNFEPKNYIQTSNSSETHKINKLFEQKQKWPREEVSNKNKQNNYEFTFGTKFQQFQPKSIGKYEKGLQLSRASDQIRSASREKQHNANLISSYQNEQFNKNIKKMELKSKYMTDSRYKGIDSDVSAPSILENSQKFLYRTQFL